MRERNLILLFPAVSHGWSFSVFSMQQKNLFPCSRKIGMALKAICAALKRIRKVLEPMTDVIAPILVSFLSDKCFASTLKSQCGYAYTKNAYSARYDETVFRTSLAFQR